MPDPVDFTFNLRVIVKAREGETEDEIFQWIQDKIANIHDVVEVYEP